jgi:hypothetical protein
MKSNLINATRTFNSLTANGALTHSTSTNYCLDFFFQAGASRNTQESDILMMWERARGENLEMAYRILFWARDCRGGAGEKRFFQVIARHANLEYPKQWAKVSILTPLYGCWKDYFLVESINDDTLNFLMHQLEESANANLLGKWFPRVGKWFKAMHNYLGCTPKQLRSRLVDLTNVVETKLCNRDWDSIDYSKVPSIAMNLYRNTFGRHDERRFNAFNQLVLEGKAKVNASVLHPHQLFQALIGGQDASAVEAQWINLTNYMEGSTERILPLCDVSGSMDGLPMDVSVSLGLYIAERNEGPFKNAFITFSENPQMHYIQDGTLGDKLMQIARSDWGYSTNLEASFDLILNSALREELSQDEMPTKLLIISDMEFNEAADGRTNLDSIRAKYANSGYVMPEIIFWNVNGRMDNVPAMSNDPGVGLVSGFSPAILTSILKGRVLSPYDLMHKAVMDSRYEPVTTMLEL